MNLIELIKDRVDPDELIDILGLSTEELLDLLYIKMLVLERPELFEFLEPNEEPENPFEEE